MIAVGTRVSHWKSVEKFPHDRLFSFGSASVVSFVSVGSEEGHLCLSIAEQRIDGGEDLLSSSEQTSDGPTVCSALLSLLTCVDRSRVVDAQQLARHFTESELRELYSFKPDEHEPQEYLSKPTPVDLILRECLKANPTLVQNILEHDSLLENHVEEQLTREEKYFAIKELEREERQAEYQSAVAKTLAAMAQNNNNANTTNLNPTLSSESKSDRKLISLGPVNSYNPYQPPAPMCAQARAGLSTAQEARGLERLTELLFPREASALPPGKDADLPPLKSLTDVPVSKEELADLNLDDEDDFDPRTKKEKQKALLQEQRAPIEIVQ